MKQKQIYLSDDTERAIAWAEAVLSGQIKAKRYNSVKEVFADL